MPEEKSKTVKVKITKELKELEIFKEYDLDSTVSVTVETEHPTDPPIHL